MLYPRQRRCMVGIPAQALTSEFAPHHCVLIELRSHLPRSSPLFPQKSPATIIKGKELIIYLIGVISANNTASLTPIFFAIS